MLVRLLTLLIDCIAAMPWSELLLLVRTLQISCINGLTGSVGLVRLLTLERRGLVC